MTDLERYCTSVLNGEITACRKIKLVAERLLEQLYNPGKYHFDAERANKPIEFIEKFCKVPSGKVGVPLKLELFQKARLQALFGFVDDNGTRQYNECLIIEGRKNGKTTENAALELYMLVADHEGSPQVYNVATSRDQAILGFNAAHKMVIQSPMLSKHVRKRAADLYFAHTMGFIKPLASNTNSLDGLDVHCAVVDELAAIKNRDLYDLVKQAMSARRQPILFTITTNGFVREGVFDAQYDYATAILEGKAENEHFLPFIYELDDRAEWDKEECWIKANPGLDTIKSRDYLRQCVQKAKDDPAFKPTVMVKDFNMPQTAESAWLRYEDLHSEEMFDISEFDYCIGSFDAADTTDLNSAKAIFARPNDDKIYFLSMYWIPQEVLDRQAEKGDRRGRDNVDYQLWVDQGYMRTCAGNKCDKRIFLDWFRELRDDHGLYVQRIFYDPWHIGDEEKRAFEMEFGSNVMVPVRQGVISLSEPMKNLAADFQAHKIVYNNNPIDEWCLYNTEVKTDVNGNIQPVKTLDARRRIDGAVTFIMGYKGVKDSGDIWIGLNNAKQ